MFFQSPNVETVDTTFKNSGQDNYTPEYKSMGPAEYLLAQEVNAGVPIPTYPTYVRVRVLEAPEVPRHTGWMEAIIPGQVQKLPYDYSSPDILVSGKAYPEQLYNAAHPKNTLSATGITKALRSPAINEGY